MKSTLEDYARRSGQQGQAHDLRRKLCEDLQVKIRPSTRLLGPTNGPLKEHTKPKGVSAHVAYGFVGRNGVKVHANPTGSAGSVFLPVVLRGCTVLRSHAPQRQDRA